jgi:hypothetical protein
MDCRNDVERAERYRQEASACARAALTTAVAEIKQAYLELEQGWLSLAPKPKNILDDFPEAEPDSDSDQPRHPQSEKIVGDVDHQTTFPARRKSKAKATASPMGRT